MTSPSQLKYLDAMGVPVWVSRDLVIQVEKISVSVADEIDKLDTNYSPTENIQADTASSAQSILNALDQSVIPKNTLKDVVVESVEHAKLPVEPTNAIVEKPKGENLIFQTNQHYMFASGNESADWMVIGHSPERYNGIGQEPFAGDAGILLDNMIRSVGVDNPRRDAYFVNIFDFKKTQNQNSDNELNKYLINLIGKINPKLVLIVGQNAAQNLLQVDDPLIIMRSKIHQITAKNLPCVVTYYPNFLLQKPIDKRKAWNDLKLAMSAISDVS